MPKDLLTLKPHDSGTEFGMNIYVSITDDGVKAYPPHKHNHPEIMTYLKGSGYLYTPERNYTFEEGTVIIVPAGIIHGSVSDRPFVNISIGGEFEGLLPCGNSVVSYSKGSDIPTDFARIIFKNRYSGNDILKNLCNAYVMFLAQNMQFGNTINSAIDKIITEINDHAFDSNIGLNGILNSSGYAEDYTRTQFKKFTGKTPISFLTDIRISRACFLINVYGKKLSMQEIAYRCGFVDYSYFSKRFKTVCGIAPKEHLHKLYV